MGEIRVLKVSKNSVPNKVASAIVGNIREGFEVHIQGIGAASINQSVKAVAVANDFVAEENFYLVALPEFVSVDIDGQERTAIKIIVEKHEKKG